MSTKQELQSQIDKLKAVITKSEGKTKQIFESTLIKAEAKLKELEKAEKLDKSGKDLTDAQDKKIDDVKKDSKSLVNSLKDKVAKAKAKISKVTPKSATTKKGGAKSVAKAKELAKERRSGQKGVSTKDSDIEKDAGRTAINKTKRKSQGGRANQYGTKEENKGGTYYEKRENRFDKQNKRYPKLEDGGMMAKGGQIGDSGIITDKKSMFMGKMGVIVGELGNSYQVRVLENGNERTVLVSKRGIDIMKDDEYADGGMTKSSRITKGSKYMRRFKTTSGDSGYDVIEIVDTNYFSNKYGGSPNTIRYKIIESSIPKEIGTYDEDGRKNFQTRLKYGMMEKISYNDGGLTDIGGTQFNDTDLSGMFANGGKIKNQYEGKTPEDIWNNLTKEQRSHFIYDHKHEIEEYRGEEYGDLSSKEIIKAYNSNYNELDKNIKNRFNNHTREGQYAKGGEVKVGDMIKSKTIKGKVYQSMGTMFKIEDEYGNKNPKYYSTRDFKNSEIIRMAKGGEIYEGGYSSMRELNEDFKRIITNKERNEFETSENTYVGKTVTIKLPNMADSFRMKVKNEYAEMVSGGGKNGGVYSKKYIISKGEGGTTTFTDKIKSIKASLLKRKKVSPSVQKDYGKTYSKSEALDSAKRIAGAMRKKEMAKKKA